MFPSVVQNELLQDMAVHLQKFKALTHVNLTMHLVHFDHMGIIFLFMKGQIFIVLTALPTVHGFRKFAPPLLPNGCKPWPSRTLEGPGKP